MEPVIVRPIWDNSSTAWLYYGQDVIKSLKLLSDASVHTVCTSPPYWGLRDYGTGDAQIGLEKTPDEFVERLVQVFREVARVLRPDGTLWLNLGDSFAAARAGHTAPPHKGVVPASARGENAYGEFRKAKGGGPRDALSIGLKHKDLVGIPWRVAFGLQADGWYLRSDIIWAKSSCMPESVRDRPTKAHEYVFLFAHPDSKGRYYYDADAIRESTTRVRSLSSWEERKADEPVRRGDPGVTGHVNSTDSLSSRSGRNKRSWWNINPKPYRGAHFAVWPPKLVEPMIRAGCPMGGTVLDPFSGSATTGMVALQERRDYIGIDLNADYLPLAEARILGEKAPSTVSQEVSLVEELFG